MREHANLPAMVRFVRHHVTQHLHPHRPRPRPSISAKFLDSPIPSERLRQHFHAARPAFGQSNPRLFRRAIRTLQLWRNFQMRRGQPHPLTTDVMHVRKDRRNRSHLARRLRIPSRGIQMLDQQLVHPLIRRKDPRRCSAGFLTLLRSTLCRRIQCVVPSDFHAEESISERAILPATRQ